MKNQNDISATRKGKRGSCRNQAELADALGIGKTSHRDDTAGRGDPDGKTFQQTAQKMGISLGELVSGEEPPYENAFDLISGMLETLHPSLYKMGEFLWTSMLELFRCSERCWEEDPNWRYTVTEPRPLQYGLRADRRTEEGWKYVKESAPFTEDPDIARSAAELFTRNALSPIHLEEAIEDFLKSV